MTRGSTEWFTSSYSNAAQNCVEVRFDGGAVDVRDSKARELPAMRLTAASWRAFLTTATGV